VKGSGEELVGYRSHAAIPSWTGMNALVLGHGLWTTAWSSAPARGKRPLSGDLATESAHSTVADTPPPETKAQAPIAW
jgi:hypothetical protein